MRSDKSDAFGALQAVIGAVYILAFLVAIAFTFQPYSRDLLPCYVLVFVVIVATLVFSRVKLAIVASGFAVLALRCMAGLFATSHHIVAFLLGSAISASIAWFLLKASIKRYG